MNENSLAMTIERSIRSGNLVWRDIMSPRLETLQPLQEQYHFHELDLEDCISKSESPKIEEYKDYIFVVFHFPIKDPHEHVVIAPLSMFIGQEYLITVSNGNIPKLNDIFERLKQKSYRRRTVFGKGSGYLLYIIMEELFGIYNNYIAQLNRAILEIEDDIFEGNVLKDRLYDIMDVKRQIITLKRALLPHSPIILLLERLHKRFINKTLELYFDNVADKITRAKNSLESLSETIEAMYAANESLTSHNTNRVMKILTIFSVTLLPLNLLASIYGMNIPLPLAQYEDAFMAILAIMLMTFILSLVFFKVKRYL